MTMSSLFLAVSFLPFFEAKNTAVNNIINPLSAQKANTAACVKPEILQREKCCVCKAAGFTILEERDFGQFTTHRMNAPKKIKQTCPFCGGRKHIEAFCSPTDLKLLVARERTKFESDHLSRGEVPVGKAFVPKETYDRLDRKEIKLIKESYGEPCRLCHWIGVVACRKCDANGYLKCPNDDCKDGWMVTKTESTYTKTSSGGRTSRGCSGMSSSSRRVTRRKTDVNVLICPECSGASVIKCPKCSGRRAIPCRRCNGLGMK